MQEEVFVGVISLTDQDLAGLIAFAHDADEQKKLTEKQIPKRFHKMAASEFSYRIIQATYVRASIPIRLGYQLVYKWHSGEDAE